MIEIRALLVLLLGCIIHLTSFSQEYRQEKISDIPMNVAIDELKMGTLVVRLHANKRVSEYLREQGKEDLAIKKEEETQAYNSVIINGFRQYYSFSDIAFTYGYLIEEDGLTLINDEGVPDKSIKIGNGKVYYLDMTDAGKYYNEFPILDKDFNMMPKEFPSFDDLGAITRFFMKMSNKNVIKRQIERFDVDLHTF